MLDFTINHIIGEAYNKVLTWRWVLEASQETNYTPTTNNVQDKVYEDAVRNALKSLGLKDYPKRTALLTKIMGRIASRPKNRSYQDQINYIYNYYKNIGKNDLANKIVKVANHIFQIIIHRLKHKTVVITQILLKVKHLYSLIVLHTILISPLVLLVFVMTLMQLQENLV